MLNGERSFLARHVHLLPRCQRQWSVGEEAKGRIRAEGFGGGVYGARDGFFVELGRVCRGDMSFNGMGGDAVTLRILLGRCAERVGWTGWQCEDGSLKGRWVYVRDARRGAGCSGCSFAGITRGGRHARRACTLLFLLLVVFRLVVNGSACTEVLCP